MFAKKFILKLANVRIIIKSEWMRDLRGADKGHWSLVRPRPGPRVRVKPAITSSFKQSADCRVQTSELHKNHSLGADLDAAASFVSAKICPEAK